MLIPHAVFPIERLCGESNRYALSGVLLERDGGECRAVVTDARVLLVAEWTEPVASPYDDSARGDSYRRLVNGAAWVDAGKALKTSAKDAGGWLHLDERDGSVEVCTLAVRCDLPTLDMRFPPYRDLMKRQPSSLRSEPVKVETFDAVLMLDLLAVVKAVLGADRKEVTRVEWELAGGCRHAAFKASRPGVDVRLSGCMMPLSS